MIRLKRLLNEDIERKYLLPPNGDIFQVRDHVYWAAKGILQKKYGNYSNEHLSEVIEDVYDDLELLGYKILLFSPDDTLYIRGNNGIHDLSSYQRRKIEDLSIKLGEEGTHVHIQLEDDGGHYETIWTHPSYIK
jgi:hypothetical protein